MVENLSMHIPMPDVTVVGGIGELKKIGDMLHAWGLPTAHTVPFGPVVIAAGVHAMASLPGFLILEYGWGEIPWRKDLTIPGEEIVNGRIRINDRPGLGVELNPETVEKHRVKGVICYKTKESSMFKSLNAGAIGVRGSVDELIGYAKRAGFQGVDPNIQEIASLVNTHVQNM